MAQEIKVTNCNDCIFMTMAGWEGEKDICKLDEEKRVVAEWYNDAKEHPEWCPLKKEPVNISLK